MPWATHEPSDLDENIALIRRWRAEFDADQDYVYGIFERTEATVLGGTGLARRRQAARDRLLGARRRHQPGGS